MSVQCAYISVGLSDIVKSHRQSEANIANVTSNLQQMCWHHSPRQSLLPQLCPGEGSDDVHDEGGDHGEVVPPGQVEHPSVVLLPVRDQETDVDIPEETEHPQWRQGHLVIIATKHGVDCPGDEDC